MLRRHIIGLQHTYTVTAQPPDIARWTGLTAQSQAQGFSQGDPLRLTWGFVNDGLNIPNFGAGLGPAAPSDVQAWLTNTYGSFDAGVAVFESTFDRWSSISGLEYTFQTTDDNAAFATSAGNANRADIRIGGRPIDGNNGVLAFNFFPNSGDMVIDTSDSFFNNAANDNLASRNVIAHEHGHGVGMAHVEPVSFQFLMEPVTLANPTFDGPQHHDILIAQRGYGDAFERSNGQLGNDTAALATSLGVVADGATVAIGQDAATFAVAITANDFVSIDDQTDTDFYSFDIDQSAEVSLGLQALGFEYDIGPEDNIPNNEIPFDTQSRSDLVLSLFDQDGSTLLAQSDITGLGGAESIDDFLLSAPGTYFVQITGTDNADALAVDTQFYGLTISAAFTAIPEPGSFALLALIGSAACLRRRSNR